MSHVCNLQSLKCTVKKAKTEHLNYSKLHIRLNMSRMYSLESLRCTVLSSCDPSFCQCMLHRYMPLMFHQGWRFFCKRFPLSLPSAKFVSMLSSQHDARSWSINKTAYSNTFYVFNIYQINSCLNDILYLDPFLFLRSLLFFYFLDLISAEVHEELSFFLKKNKCVWFYKHSILVTRIHSCHFLLNRMMHLFFIIIA